MEKRPHNFLHSMGHNKIQNFVHEIKVLFEVGVGGFSYTFEIPVYQRRGGGWMVIRAHNSYRSMVASNFKKMCLDTVATLEHIQCSSLPGGRDGENK